MKKPKLFLSVISLCFAMAMLTYGIFAATSVSYSVRGKVSYTVTDAYVEVQTKVYKKTSPLAGTLQALVDTAVSDVTDLTLVQTSDTYSSAGGQNGSFGYNDLAFATGENGAYAYIFVVSVTNLSEDINVWAAVKETLAPPPNVSAATNQSQAEIGKYTDEDNAATKNIVVGITVTAWETNITAGQNDNFSFAIDIGSDAMPSQYLSYNELVEQSNSVAKLQFVDQGTTYSVKLDPANSEGELYIPEEYNGKKVTKVENQENDNTQNPVMIQNEPLDLLFNYTKIVIPDSVEEIEKGALAGCSKLVSLTIPFVGRNRDVDETADSVIGWFFEESEIAKDGFVLTRQKYNDMSPSCNYYFTSLLPSSLKEVIVTSAKQLPIGAFCCVSSIEKIVLENSCLITELKGRSNYSDCASFNYCSGLKEVVLNNRINKINERLFEGSVNLEKIIIPRSVETIVWWSNFYTCSKLVIYAEAYEKPDGWVYDWNYGNNKLYWYSEIPNADGNHWHYVNGCTVVWE